MDPIILSSFASSRSVAGLIPVASDVGSQSAVTIKLNVIREAASRQRVQGGLADLMPPM
jgi:hypothetical protein